MGEHTSLMPGLSLTAGSGVQTNYTSFVQDVFASLFTYLLLQFVKGV